MKTDDCCADCRAIVDAPNVDHEPHGALHTFGTSRIFADFDTDDYECRTCRATFTRTQAKPSGAVTWVLLPPTE
jgi:hypothetical protein